MTTNWLVRGILALIALEVGVCTTFLADEWAPLRDRENGLFSRFLSATRMGRQFVLDPSPDDDRTRIARPLRDGFLRPILRVDVDEDPERHFESYPLSPIDWAVILRNTRDFGCRVAVVEPPLVWDDTGELPLRALDRALAEFERAVLTVDLRRAANGQALPPWLAGSGVPVKNVRGNLGVFPRVNRVILPPSATASGNALFAFRIIEGESPTAAEPGGPGDPDRPQLLPAFAIWDDILVPSLPVAIAMAQQGIGPEEVHVLVGEHVRIGDSGPVVAIDGNGQLAYRLVDKPEFSSTTADTLIEPDFLSSFLPGDAPGTVLFADATATNPSPWSKPERYQRIVSSLDALPHPELPESHARFPLWGEVGFLGLVALGGGMLLRTSRKGIPLGLTLLLLLAIGGLGAILYYQRFWMPLAPIVTTVVSAGLLAWKMSSHLRRPVET
jgi:hypothetical protein